MSKWWLIGLMLAIVAVAGRGPAAAAACFDDLALPLLLGTEGPDTLGGGPAAERICGLAGDDVLLGRGGDDWLSGDADADILTGGDGNDVLRGRAGPDQLSGDGGDDTLAGDAGDDSYVYRLGDGHDVIHDCWGNNVVRFEQIARNLGSATRDGNDLLLSLNAAATDGSVRVIDYFAGCRVRFAVDNQTNIVLIYADDLGYGDVGAYGETPIETPRLDQMAADGLQFLQFYSSSPHCPPARDALLTGRHTGHTWVRHGGKLPDTTETVADRLKAAGYVTGVFGKWGMSAMDGDMVTDGDPAAMGFDAFTGVLQHRDAHVYYLDSPADLASSTPAQPFYFDVRQHLYTIENGTTVSMTVSADQYVHDLYVDAAIDFIETHRGAPFFLYLPWTIPHAELAVPDDAIRALYLDAGGNSIFPETPYTPELDGYGYDRTIETPRANYAAMITRLDRDVGRLLDTLAAVGLAENTLVLFTSDNGPHDESGIDRDDPDMPFDSSGGLRGRKYELYEGGIRVPMLAYWPGTTAPGVVDAPAIGYDLFATLLDVAGAAEIPPTDGQTLLPLLRGEPYTPHDTYYWEAFTTTFAGQAVRQGDWKLVREGTQSASDPVYLYHIATDPGETVDVAADNCALVQQLKQQMNDMREDPVWNPDGIFSIVPLTIDTCP